MHDVRQTYFDTQQLKCPVGGCLHLVQWRSNRLVLFRNVDKQPERYCPAHEVQMTACSRDEFSARTSVH